MSILEKVVISILNVTMTYKLSTLKIDSFKEYFIRKVKKEISYKEFSALQDVSFEIKKGARIGIIGDNGAGKSTLLKIISKVIKPTNGSVKVIGNVAPLLELGAGFDQELTGRKNIYLNGAILGKNKEYLDNQLEEIIKFADLGEFIDVPLKNYSSGMKARLGFAVASHIDADIIILDEVLGVGDKNFKVKSQEKIRELIFSGKTIILVSHSLGEIENLTDTVIWLEHGKIRKIGETKEILDEYRGI